MAVLIACLRVLRAEFDTLAPGRDKGADGWIGDTAHRARVSDHNPDETGATPFKDADNVDEVHAIDIDATGPWPAGKDLAWAVELIRGRHLRGFDNRLQNIIYRGRICSKSWGWTWRDYDGADQHYGHAHLSAVYTSGQEADTRPWGLLGQLAAPPRKVTMEKLDGYALPILELGDDDADFPGYDRIGRVQRLLGVTDDGQYGPKTAAALKELGINDGRTIDLPVWRKLYGLSQVG